MQKRRAILFLLIFLLNSVRADTQLLSPNFADYPQAEWFRFYLNRQTNAPQFHGKNLLAITAFQCGERCALQYLVTETGQELDYRHVYEWAIQASRSKQLSETDLINLRAAAKELPTKNVSPPLERLVLISFRDGTNWVTRSYDTADLPKAMRQIYEIVGERFETRPRKSSGL